jgi:hypothetical protein
MIPTFAVKAGVRYSYYRCKGSRCNEHPRCAEANRRSRARTLVGERLGAITGERISRPILERLVQRIVYNGISRGVTIELRDGSSVTSPFAALPSDEPTRRTPRISRLLALAIKLNALVGTEGVRTYSELAHIAHVSRSGLSQIMTLLNLAPDIQEELLFLPKLTSGRDLITEKAVRHVARTIDWSWQRNAFHSLMKATQDRI